MREGKPVVLLDAGHYAYYNRGVMEDYWESINNWTQQRLLKEELEKRGFAVSTTRASQERDMALYDRGYKCLADKADVFISLHSNAPGGDHPEIRGVVVHYSVSAQKKDRELAGGMAECVARVMGNGVHGVYSKQSENGSYDYFVVLRGAVASGCRCCVIIDRGFHTNEEDCRWLLNENNLRKLAVELAEYLRECFFGEEGENVRKFELISNMNVRKKPNGNVLGVLHIGTVVSGSILEQSESGTQWLHIDYNGTDAVVAVLPESKGFAREITEKNYKLLYEQEKTRADGLDKKNGEMLKDIEAAKALLNKY